MSSTATGSPRNSGGLFVIVLGVNNDVFDFRAVLWWTCKNLVFVLGKPIGAIIIWSDTLGELGTSRSVITANGIFKRIVNAMVPTITTVTRYTGIPVCLPLSIGPAVRIFRKCREE